MQGAGDTVSKIANNRAIKAKAIAKAIFQEGKDPSKITDANERMGYSRKAGYNKTFSDKTGESTWPHVIREFERLR
jgi:hypothetical protein